MNHPKHSTQNIVIQDASTIQGAVTPLLPRIKTFLLSKNVRGAFWKLVSCAAFAAINGLVRYLSHGGETGISSPLPTNVIMFFQNVIGTLLILPLFWKSGAGVRIQSSRYTALHLLRVGAAVLGVALWYLTLKYMPIAEGVALTFTGPIFTVLGASLLLKERLTKIRLLALSFSLVGAFIISRPDLAFTASKGGLGLVALLPLASALSLAWNKLLTRKLAGLGETPELLATYLLLLMTPFSLIPAAFEWVTPSLEHWPWLLLLGFFGMVAHLAFGRAYALAEVTFLTPIGFSKFLFSTFVGFYFFSEIPSKTLWIGISVIGLGIICLSHKMPLYSIARRFRSS